MAAQAALVEIVIQVWATQAIIQIEAHITAQIAALRVVVGHIHVRVQAPLVVVDHIHAQAVAVAAVEDSQAVEAVAVEVEVVDNVKSSEL